VVIRDGKALLIRRGQEPRRGWWQIPGGYVEHDESFDEAVVREVEHDEQERGGEHTRVVLKDPGRVAEAARESRVRTGRSGQPRVNEREPDPKCGQADDRARA